MTKERTLDELRADPHAVRLITNEQVDSQRSPLCGPRPQALVDYQSSLFAAGWVYEIPAHEWVSPGGQRGRLAWQPVFERGDDGKVAETGQIADIWMHDRDCVVLLSLSGTNPFTKVPLR